MRLDNLMGLSETTIGQVNYREDLYWKVQHCDFLKKFCVTFLSKFQNPASITLCINVLSVYPPQNTVYPQNFCWTPVARVHNTNVHQIRLNKMPESFWIWREIQIQEIEIKFLS